MRLRTFDLGKYGKGVWIGHCALISDIHTLGFIYRYFKLFGAFCGWRLLLRFEKLPLATVTSYVFWILGTRNQLWITKPEFRE